MVSLACGLGVTTGSGRVETESRAVSGFDSVDLSGTGDLVITQGESEALTIEAEDNILPHIKTEVKGGELVIGFDRDDWNDIINPTRPIKFNLTVKNLSGVTISGSGSITAASLNADRLELNVSGSGSVAIDQLQASDLVFDLSGSGQADLSGQVTSQEIHISGSGNYNAGDLQCQDATLDSSGSAQVTLWVEDSLDVQTSGSGSIRYYGSPQINTDSSGSSTLQSLGDK
jgi:hypothetical protein